MGNLNLTQLENMLFSEKQLELKNKPLLYHHIVEKALYHTKSDLSCLYLLSKDTDEFILSDSKGNFTGKKVFKIEDELIQFLMDCNETIVILEQKESPFSGVLLDSQMQSGLMVPFYSQDKLTGFLIVNSLNSHFYNADKIHVLESLLKLTIKYH